MEREPKTVKPRGGGWAAVKAEYVVSLRETSKPGEGRGGGGADSTGQESKGSRGRNTKRPRDERPDVRKRLCKAFLRGDCTYTTCRFSHDIKAVLADRPPDLGSRCYIWDIRGSCPYGIHCRFGASHLNLATGVSIIRSPEDGGVIDSDAFAPLNTVKFSMVKDLRNRKYKFRCEEKGFKQYLKALEQMSDKQTEAEEQGVVDPGGEEPEPPTGVLPYKEKRPIDFSGKVYVAPLTTVGNLPFRRIMKEQGADITCGEMALVQNLLKGQQSEWTLLKKHRSEDIFGVQLAGAHPDQLTRVAEVIEDNVAVDFVDLNLGCPIDLICNKGMGSALMSKKRKLRGIMQGMTSILSCPITIKMRVGWDAKSPNAHVLAKLIQKHGRGGVGAIMVHGRGRLQRYTKLADWGYVNDTVAAAQTPDLPQIPVIGNGDILSYVDHLEHQKDSRLSSCCMIGRGALIKPWLPTEVKEQRHIDISASERLEIIKSFVNYGLEHWGSDQRGVDITRRFLLEWLSFLHRYIPVGLLEHLPQHINERPPPFVGRSDLETLLSSGNSGDWVKVAATNHSIGPCWLFFSSDLFAVFSSS
ncbi:unnamed protein product [Chrysoparadoxa australica]